MALVRNKPATIRCRRAVLTCVGAAVTAMMAASTAPALGIAGSAETVVLPVSGGQVSVVPASMAITAVAEGGQRMVLSAPAADALGAPGPIVRRGGEVPGRIPSADSP